MVQFGIELGASSEPASGPAAERLYVRWRGLRMISIGGPVEQIKGQLVLRIPLEAGGSDLIECSRGVGSVEGEFLVIVIQTWLAEKLGLFVGSSVIVDNAEGKLNIRSNDPRG